MRVTKRCTYNIHDHQKHPSLRLARWSTSQKMWGRSLFRFTAWFPRGSQTQFCSGNFTVSKYMGVSINGGTPKWMVYKGKSHLSWWFSGTPFQETSIYVYTCSEFLQENHVQMQDFSGYVCRAWPGMDDGNIFDSLVLRGEWGNGMTINSLHGSFPTFPIRLAPVSWTMVSRVSAFGAPSSKRSLRSGPTCQGCCHL